MKSIVSCFLLIICGFIYNAQNSMQRGNVKKYHFLSAGIEAGPAFGIGSISKNSTKQNALGKFNAGGGLKIDVDAILKQKYGLGIGLEYSFNKLTNNVLHDSIMGNLNNKKINNGDIPYNPLLIIGRFFISGSRYFKFGERLWLQPKLELGIGLMAYDYTAMINYTDGGTNMLATYDGNSVALTTLVPELNIKYIFFRRNWLDLAINLGINYYYAKPTFIINENKGEFFAAFSTYKDQTFMTAKDPLNLINTHIGLTWLFKWRERE